MPELDLVSDDGLRVACQGVESDYQESAKSWTEELARFLTSVRKADKKTRADEDFQRRLWDENPVSSVGQGNIAVAKALADPDFRKWLAAQSLEPLPERGEQRVAVLTKLYEAILERLKEKTDRTPHLKVFRVLAAFYPNDFTTIAHRWKLMKLVRRMGGDVSDPVAGHSFVVRRLNEVLGQPEDKPSAIAWRMEIPWYLYERIDAETPETERVERAGMVSGDETLVPLPAARRRRGLTSIQGGLPTVLGILEFCKPGVMRDDLLDQIQTTMPGLQENSRRVVINVLQSELGVLKRVGDTYRLTDQGLATLESGEASELGNWMLTRILGVDHVLKLLQGSPRSRSELMDLLQRVNPGWTTTFAPSAMISWLVSLGVVMRQEDGKVSLTPLGVAWASRITWEPEFLKGDDAPKTSEAPVQSAVSEFRLPPIEQIVADVQRFGAFDRQVIEKLHIGLWTNALTKQGAVQTRHFAILTGISGSGKTLLARRYAEAISAGLPDADEHVLIEAVQPGWYEPAPLLGFLNPLRADAYTRTPFLRFLMRVAQDPLRPYVVILDEMNLSHPEQYLAPILSAMETGGAIRLHAEQDDYDGVPSSIAYPPNLAIIGTVNMDETTHGISDKVLDRAFTIEFWSMDLNAYPRWGKRGIPIDQEKRIREILSDLLDALAPARLHFGWRIVDDVLNYMQSAASLSAGAFGDHLDAVIYAKVLPKLRGDDSQRFRKALEEAQTALTKGGLKTSASKVAELIQDLRETGSARYWR